MKAGTKALVVAAAAGLAAGVFRLATSAPAGEPAGRDPFVGQMRSLTDEEARPILKRVHREQHDAAGVVADGCGWCAPKMGRLRGVTPEDARASWAKAHAGQHEAAGVAGARCEWCETPPAAVGAGGGA